MQIEPIINGVVSSYNPINLNNQKPDVSNNHIIIVNNPIQQLSKKQLETINTHGLSLYKSNDFLMNVYEIMEHSKFPDFFNTYINSKNDVNVAMIYFNLFSIIKTQFKSVFERNIRKGEMIYFLKHCMSNKMMRQFAMDSANKYTSLERKITTLIKDTKKRKQINIK